MEVSGMRGWSIQIMEFGQMVSIVLVDSLVEYSDSVRISYSLFDTSRDVLRFRVFDSEGDTVFVSFYYKSADTLGSEW